MTATFAAVGFLFADGGLLWSLPMQEEATQVAIWGNGLYVPKGGEICHPDTMVGNFTAMLFGLQKR